MEKAAVHFNISQHTPLSDDPLALERGEGVVRDYETYLTTPESLQPREGRTGIF